MKTAIKIVSAKEICSDLVFCVNLGLLILSFLVEEAPHSAQQHDLLILCVITEIRALKPCFDLTKIPTVKISLTLVFLALQVEEPGRGSK